MEAIRAPDLGEEQRIIDVLHPLDELAELVAIQGPAGGVSPGRGGVDPPGGLPEVHQCGGLGE